MTQKIIRPSRGKMRSIKKDLDEDEPNYDMNNDADFDKNVAMLMKTNYCDERKQGRLGTWVRFFICP